MRFFDTLSLHMCVNGMTSFQRVLFMAHRKGSNRKEIHERREKKRMLGLPVRVIPVTVFLNLLYS